MLELDNISKRYGNEVALAPLDLAFSAQRTHVLVGPSGCGKSTLLKISLGLIQSDSGSVRISGQVLSDANVLALRQQIGYVVQSGGLFPHLTALENVSLVTRFLKWKTTRIDQRVAELADLARLSPSLLERYPAQLSGGQQQRVGLMRSLMLDPDLLLMDEPLGALDPMVRADLQSDLRSIFRKLRKTVVIVTHDLHEADYFADEVVLFRAGEMVQRGSMKDLIDCPADPFVTQFITAQNVARLGESP